MAPRVFGLPALPRLNSGIARCLPVATTVLAALLTILPVRIPGYATLTPALALMATYHWAIYRPELLPPFALFAIGLGEDLLSGAPIGATALLLLMARAGVVKYRRYFVNQPFPFVWAGFTVLAGVAMLAFWALHCALAASLLDIRTTVFRLVLTIAFFPVASFLLGRAQRAVIGDG